MAGLTKRQRNGVTRLSFAATVCLLMLGATSQAQYQPVPQQPSMANPVAQYMPGQAATVNAPVCCEPQEIILIRGGICYWPRSQWLADEFRNLGYIPTTINAWDYPFVARRIAKGIQEGRRSPDIIIVGYSSGADTACLLARKLQTYGLRVKTMVLIDSTLGVSVPANVDYCENFYISRPLDAVPVFRGVPVEPEGPDTVLINYDLRGTPDFEDPIRRCHLFIASTEAMRRIAVNVVETRQGAPVSGPPEQVINTIPGPTFQR